MATTILAVPGTSSMEAMIQRDVRLLGDDTTLWRPYWTNGLRGPTTQPQYGWSWGVGWWPNSSGFYNDPSTPSCLMFERNQQGGLPTPFEPNHYGNPGCASTKFIIGTCKDSNGNPLGGSIVQGFRTSDDMYIGDTGTDDNGRYELRCPNTPTDQHYLVAYYDSGTDLAGTTVNTLVPTWRDGTV